MSPFVQIRELERPEDVRALLASPETQCREGCSAYELATSWMSAWRTARDLPAPVRRVLDGCPAYRGAALAEACFERRVDLGTPGRASQTDLMLKMRLPDGLAVIAVEGKVEESFGQRVGRWNTAPGRDLRLTDLCRRLGLPRCEADGLRYQLLHRTASALIEAERYAARHAMVLVHSFSRAEASLADFLRFAAAVTIRDAGRNRVSEPHTLGGIELRLAWVSDAPSV